MQATVPNIARLLQEVFIEEAEALGKSSGFIQRQRALTGTSFAAGLVFGWLSDEAASLSGLQQMVGGAGSVVSRQGLAQRFTPAAVGFMQQLLACCLRKRVAGERQTHPSLASFEHIYVLDSTKVQLPDALGEVWRGNTGSGLKISLCWDLHNGEWVDCHLHHGSEHDRHAPVVSQPVPPKTLYLADLGYFNLSHLKQLQAGGADWIISYKTGTCLFTQAGKPMNLLATLATLPAHQPCVWAVRLGDQAQISCYLVAQRATPQQQAGYEKKVREYEHAKQVTATQLTVDLCAYTVYLTTLDPTSFPPAQVFALANLRWQIERLFCLWKTHLELDDSRSLNPDRILCELYAKLIAALIQQWLFLLGEVHQLHLSLFQARNLTRQFAAAILAHLFDDHLLQALLARIAALFHNCRICSSRGRPSHLQQLDP